MIVEKRRASISAGELAYVDVGDGPVVVLLHGFPQSSHVWRSLAPALASRFRVIAPDLLGTGDSSKPLDASLSLHAQAGYVRELLAALSVERFAVVGHGLGGGIAQLLALEGPGVEALVLLDAVPLDARPGAVVRAPPGSSMGPSETTIRSTFRAGMAHPDRMSDGDLAEYLRPFAGPDGEAALLRLARAMEGDRLPNPTDKLGDLQIPVLIFWGEDDPFLPAEVGERLNAAIPSSTLGILPGCRHFLVDDAAETIGPMIHEYLRARYLGVPHGHGDPTGAVRVQLERRPPWLDVANDGADDRLDDEEEDDE